MRRGKGKTGAGERTSFYLAADLVGKLPAEDKSKFINEAIRAALQNSETNRENMIVEKKMNEQELLKIAEAIYSEISGADNRQERAATVDEIYNWLYNGDNPNYTMSDVPALVAEWKEYGGE